MAKKVNSSMLGMQMRRAVEYYVAAQFRAEAKTMAALVGGPAERWVERTQEVLRRR